jgi:hypothetical protein
MEAGDAVVGKAQQQATALPASNFGAVSRMVPRARTLSSTPEPPNARRGTLIYAASAEGMK